MSNLKTPSNDYEFHSKNWKTCRALCKGERVLKDMDKGCYGTFLIQPCSNDKSEENKQRYLEYVERAALYNFTKRTEAGMAGMVFSKPIKIELNPKLEYMRTDCDGGGLGIEQLLSETLIDVLETGNEGFLVDFPKTEKETNEQESIELGIRAQIKMYKAETILESREKDIGGNRVLSFVKLLEEVEEVSEEDEYKLECKKYIRILRLNELNQYEQVLFDDKEQIEEVYPVLPLNGKGEPFTYIPFFFCGAINNTPRFDVAPLLEIADLNIKHYRNSAEWEDSCYYVGQPTTVFTGLTSQWASDTFKDGEVKLGSRAAPILLPVGGSAMMLQPQPNTMAAEGMKAKESQAISLGARLITESTANETAQAAFIKHSTDASAIKVVVNNINNCMKSVLTAVSEFQNTDDNSVVELNNDLISDYLDATQISAMVASWQAGVIDKEVLQAKFLKAGIIPDGTDLDKMNRNISDNPQGINLGGM